MVPWIQARETVAVRELPPFFRDPVVARILPFAIFMLTALLASTLSQTPGLVYPLRALAVAAVMAPFIGFYIALGWRIDLSAVGVGIVIAVMWVAIPVEPAEAAPYGALTGGLLVLWFIARGIGTAVLVPIFEELFFRDYLEGLFRRGSGQGWAIGAAIGSAILFAALHDRWAEAFVAGLLFSWLAARPGGRITDAILAHMVANGLIFGVAFVTGRLEII
jgi:exosortase E/protease (VPEID-CTERM system)